MDSNSSSSSAEQLEVAKARWSTFLIPLLSREFLVSLLIMAIGCGLMARGKLQEGMELVTWGATGYLGARTATKITEIIKGV